jgi:transposase InsO family protein
MPWKEETTMSMKQKFISRVLEKSVSISALCREFNISRDCGYKWLKRYEEMGEEGLKEKSRRPHASPFKTPILIETAILEVRRLHPAWGARKIYAYLTQQGIKELPNPSTITRILHRHGKIVDEESQKRKAFIRFEHELPNQLWQMDFKGHFAMATGRCSPLTILDDCSRYSLALRACQNQREVTVRPILIEIFREYGLPERITADNGSPWGNSSAVHGYTNLEVWLIRLGINITHSRPFHPQTQGKDERFHRTLKEELLKGREFTDIEDIQRQFDEWRRCYNEQRPHEAICMRPPTSKYTPSTRRYPECLPEIEYESGSVVRRVQTSGEIYYGGERYFISESMYGMHVKLVESERKGIMEVYLCAKKVKEIDLINKIVGRRIK